MKDIFSKNFHVYILKYYVCKGEGGGGLKKRHKDKGEKIKRLILQGRQIWCRK